jgi:hypothetical protein
MSNMKNVSQRILKLLGGQAILAKVPLALIFDLVTTKSIWQTKKIRRTARRPYGQANSSNFVVREYNNSAFFVHLKSCTISY